MHLAKEMVRRVLSDAKREQFVHDGFVKLENSFPSEIAAEVRVILWTPTGCDPEDRRTWTRPVIRLGDFAQEPFRQAVNMAALHSAFDELVGVGRTRTIRETQAGMRTRAFRPINRLSRLGRISIGASI